MLLVILLRRIRRLINILDFRSVRVRLLCKKHSIVVINEFNFVVILGFGIRCGVRHRLRSCRKLRSLRIRISIIVLPAGKFIRKFLGRISLRLRAVVCRSDSGLNLRCSLKHIPVIVYKLNGISQVLNKLLAVNRTENRHNPCIKVLVGIARNVCYRRNKSHRTAIGVRSNAVSILRDVDGNLTAGSTGSITDAYTGIIIINRTGGNDFTARYFNIRTAVTVNSTDTRAIRIIAARSVSRNRTAADCYLISGSKSSANRSCIVKIAVRKKITSGRSVNRSTGNRNFSTGVLILSAADGRSAPSGGYGNLSS